MHLDLVPWPASAQSARDALQGRDAANLPRDFDIAPDGDGWHVVIRGGEYMLVIMADTEACEPYEADYYVNPL